MTYRLLLLTSYCGGDNSACTNDLPCSDCMEMCNVFEANDAQPLNLMKNIGGLDHNRPNTTLSLQKEKSK